MIKLPLETIIQKIREKTGMTQEEVRDKIKQKMQQLAGLISEEGAGHILANENSIKLFEEESGRLKIAHLLPGMRNVEIAGRIQDIFEVRTFQKEERTGKVGSFMIGDETGLIRVVLWGDQTEKLRGLEKGVVVKIQFVYIKDNQGRKEVHLRDNSNMIINPPDEVVGEVKKRAFTRKGVYELAEERDVELLGNIMQIFDLKFFEVCPHCNKRARPEQQGFICQTHGMVEPTFSYVTNLVLDDGTGTIRTVFFANQLQHLLQKKHQEIMSLKDNQQGFEELKKIFLGKMIKISGNVNKNKMFDRLEFMVQQVDPHPPAIEELHRTRIQRITKTDEKGQQVVKEIPVIEEINEEADVVNNGQI